MSSKQNLHPTVQQFKQFIKEHPLLLQEVKEERKSLQELFEEWSILGAENEQWIPYKKATSKEEIPLENGSKIEKESVKQEETQTQSATDALGQIMGIVKRMNVQDLQNHLAQFSSVLGNVQNVIQSFQKPSNPTNQSPQDHPFSFRRD
ncbi:YlbD family protein [Halalkalibacter akibai]|uniref:Cytosolic protein n=1 Tax=Halalkalibacter akibai (strain ATCC 43226 / DSM 21942 / CIP 109018 / JCM 9157 / 1139) TaxID=1236973 RepID=W4QNY9_HALA3|nr:YlbD family protein [Halalkalibacter akibai]GAE33825.1 hypothetical protein JCM9157_851 [Halalkalibacter akibai JCM 9157]